MANKQTRDITYSEELNRRILSGVEKIYNVAKAAYGPLAGNALLEVRGGAPVLSRDGVTNVKKVFLDDEVENLAAQVVKQASEQSNQKAGDGTSAAVILTYHLYTEAIKLVAAGYNRMQVARRLEEASLEAIKHIDSVKMDIDEDKLLKSVATISAGDEAVGMLITEAIKEVGVDGGINVEDAPGSLGVVNEVVDGFYFKKGFKDIQLVNDITNLRSVYQDVPILMTDARFANTAEIAPVIEKILKSGIRQLVIVGEVVDEALGVLALTKANGILDVTVVEPPVHGGGRTLFIEDLAIVTGGKNLISKPDEFNVEEDLGMAEKVIINEYDTTILGADGSTEDKEKRIADLRDQAAESTHPQTIEALKGRMARLSGKVAVIKVGGVTEVEQVEMKLRVQDAVCAVQSALRDGIVPGGGVTLASVRGTDFDKAFKQPFRILVENGGYNPDEALAKLKANDPWMGFNLREYDELTEPSDLLEEGVIDPAQVVKEVVRNATSVASRLITTSVALTFKDRG